MKFHSAEYFGEGIDVRTKKLLSSSSWAVVLIYVARTLHTDKWEGVKCVRVCGGRRHIFRIDSTSRTNGKQSHQCSRLKGFLLARIWKIARANEMLTTRATYKTVICFDGHETWIPQANAPIYSTEDGYKSIRLATSSKCLSFCYSTVSWAGSIDNHSRQFGLVIPLGSFSSDIVNGSVVWRRRECVESIKLRLRRKKMFHKANSTGVENIQLHCIRQGMLVFWSSPSCSWYRRKLIWDKHHGILFALESITKRRLRAEMDAIHIQIEADNISVYHSKSIIFCT